MLRGLYIFVSLFPMAYSEVTDTSTTGATGNGNPANHTGSKSVEGEGKGKLQPNMSYYDYSQNGADWQYLIADEDAGEVNYCKMDTLNQSPINLLKPSGPYGWGYGVPIP